MTVVTHERPNQQQDQQQDEGHDDQTSDLLHRWHNGEREALDELVRRNLGWLRNHVRARLGPRLRAHGESHDFVQEAVVDVLTYGPRFAIADNGQFRALLSRIVENNLRDRHRWLARERRDLARNRPLPTDTVLYLDPPVRSVTRPNQTAARTEQEQHQAWVRLAIELLEPQDRDILWMRTWDALSFEEIGEHLNVSANAARMRHRKALPRLARKVSDLMQGRICTDPGATATELATSAQKPAADAAEPGSAR